MIEERKLRRIVQAVLCHTTADDEKIVCETGRAMEDIRQILAEPEEPSTERSEA